MLHLAGTIDVNHAALVSQKSTIGTWCRMRHMLYPTARSLEKIDHTVLLLKWEMIFEFMNLHNYNIIEKYPLFLTISPTW